MKKLLFVGLCCLGLAGCSVNSTNISNTDGIENNSCVKIVENSFILHDSRGRMYQLIYVDKDTKVMYLQVCSNGTAITPLYNSDGTLKLYEGEIE